MNILFYAGGGTAEPFHKAIAAPSFAIEVYQTVGELRERLRYPLDDPTIAVLVAPTRESLEELVAIRNLFADVRIIMVLPDTAPETVAKGHDLHARFLTFSDSDPNEVALVLNRMTEKARTRGHS